MAYTSPKSWAFKETLGANTDTQLQVYSDNLPDLRDRFLFMNTPTRALASSAGAFSMTIQRVSMLHSGRWLFYVPHDADAAPKIVPYAAALGDEVSLDNNFDEGGGFVDLTSAVTWLVPGMIYYVTGISHASELEVL